MREEEKRGGKGGGGGGGKGREGEKESRKRKGEKEVEEKERVNEPLFHLLHPPTTHLHLHHFILLLLPFCTSLSSAINIPQ